MIKLNKKQIQILKIIGENPGIEFDDITNKMNLTSTEYAKLVVKIPGTFLIRDYKENPRTLYYTLSKIGKYYFKLISNNVK